MFKEEIMQDSKLTAGFIVAFFMLTAISAAALKPNGGGYRLLHPEEAAIVRGGGQIAAGLGISPNTGGSSSQGGNIVLKNPMQLSI
jgi:hypothetical protein